MPSSLNKNFNVVSLMLAQRAKLVKGFTFVDSISAQGGHDEYHGDQPERDSARAFASLNARLLQRSVARCAVDWCAGELRGRAITNEHRLVGNANSLGAALRRDRCAVDARRLAAVIARLPLQIGARLMISLAHRSFDEIDGSGKRFSSQSMRGR
ncbi:MAG: hypothetical protein ABL888_19255 [Pirellulaceae bacterium]